MKHTLYCLGGLLLAASISQAQTTFTKWTFETSLPATAGPIAAEIGSGSATGFHASAAAYSSPAGNGSAHSYSANTWAVGDYWQFQTSTVGDAGISIAWEQTSSSTGPNRFNLAYSTDGASWTTVLTDYLVLTNSASANNSGTGLTTTAWSGTGTEQSAYAYAYDFSSVSALDNASSVYFRLTCDASPTSSGGTDRVDNFAVNAVSVPEPTCAALFGLGLAGLTLWRRKS